MDRSEEALLFIEEAKAAQANHDQSRAIWYWEHSLRCELRAAAYLEIAKLYLEVGWMNFETRLDAGLRCAEFEQNEKVHTELLDLRSRFEKKGLFGKRFSDQLAFPEEGDIRDGLHSVGMTKYADKIITARKPCLRMHSMLDPADEADSKFGGVPLVPMGFEWPTNAEERPLSFLCQLDFSTVPQCAPSVVLPRSGMLSFFYDNRKQPWGFNPEDHLGCVWQIKLWPPRQSKMLPLE